MFILLHASCHSFVNESEAWDNVRQATCPGLLRNGMGGSWTHNLHVMRQTLYPLSHGAHGWQWSLSRFPRCVRCPNFGIWFGIMHLLICSAAILRDCILVMYPETPLRYWITVCERRRLSCFCYLFCSSVHCGPYPSPIPNIHKLSMLLWRVCLRFLRLFVSDDISASVEQKVLMHSSCAQCNDDIQNARTGPWRCICLFLVNQPYRAAVPQAFSEVISSRRWHIKIYCWRFRWKMWMHCPVPTFDIFMVASRRRVEIYFRHRRSSTALCRMCSLTWQACGISWN